VTLGSGVPSSRTAQGTKVNDAEEVSSMGYHHQANLMIQSVNLIGKVLKIKMNNSDCNYRYTQLRLTPASSATKYYVLQHNTVCKENTCTRPSENSVELVQHFSAQFIP
jgi:hypothetical protein